MFICQCKVNNCYVKEGQHLSVGGENYIKQGGFNVYCPDCNCKYFLTYWGNRIIR